MRYHYTSYLLGAIEALLLVRLLLRLLAARPDNVAVAALFTISAVLIQPFSFLDVGQPHFGAVLEFSTLAASLFGFVVLVVWVMLHKKASFSHDRRSNAQ